MTIKAFLSTNSRRHRYFPLFSHPTDALQEAFALLKTAEAYMGATWGQERGEYLNLQTTHLRSSFAPYLTAASEAISTWLTDEQEN